MVALVPGLSDRIHRPLDTDPVLPSLQKRADQDDMSKHHFEDVDPNVRHTIPAIPGSGGKHAKSEAEENYPAFAKNIRANQQFNDRYTRANQCATIAAMAMQASGSKWNLQWEVTRELHPTPR